MTDPGVERSTARTITIDGIEYVSFAGCGYLGLAHHPDVKAAAGRALTDLGVGALASRATSGNHTLHERLESELAGLLGTEAALLAPGGYLAVLAPLQALARPGDVALIDEDGHPALWDAARAAGMPTYSYGEGDLNHALALMDLYESAGPFVLTDGTFPMQGRMAQLNVLLRHLPLGGHLIVDDSHGLGVIGPAGRGTSDAFGLDDPRLIVTSSLAKALGCAGGVVAGSKTVVRAARTSHAYVGSTPLAPPLTAAVLAAIETLRAEPARVRRLHQRTSQLHRMLRRIGQAPHGSFLPVAALDVGSRQRGLALESTLRVSGIFARYIDYPGTPAHGALRLAVNSEHTDEDMARLEAALHGFLREEEEGRAAGS
ncbi:MAG: pyridoxal phosphate-dependent aminotransferase family protein [bacterium]|nr:pyridoxal phosphate-dependent aminotransferase family protein [bacterium]